MSGKWSFHTDTPEALWAVDEDGGEGIIDYALSRGMDEAVDLFRDWLKARCLERQRERKPRGGGRNFEWWRGADRKQAMTD